jgi:hypothetical protein
VPRFEFLAPDIRGVQAEGYGAVINGNAWTFIDPGDVEVALDFETLSYSNPPGSLSGRPTGSTSRVIWQSGAGIDTSLYRALCFEFQLFGPRDIGNGSVAKVLYGNARSVMTVSSPVIVQEGTNEYCLGDIAQLRIDPNANPLAPGEWSGNMRYIRFDPHEFIRTNACNNNPSAANCRDVRIDQFVLAPFHHGDSGFNFQWTDSDADDNATIEIWLDDDDIPGNSPGSVEHLLGQLTENDPADAFKWNRPAGIAAGQWNVYALVDDGRNLLVRYASGPLVLGSYTPPPPGLLFRDGFE